MSQPGSHAVQPTLLSCRSIAYQKHLPVYSEDDWALVVSKYTTGRKPVGRYIHSQDLSLNHGDIRRIEFLCVTIGNRIAQKGGAFWIKLNRVIGANDGEETNLVYAELSTDGGFHGRPITPSQLNRMGVRAQDQDHAQSIPWNQQP